MSKLSSAKRSSILNIMVFTLSLIMVGLLSVLLEKPTYSEVEKRDLATMPQLSSETYFSGEYAARVDRFYADTFPARDFLVLLASTLDDWRGVRVDDVKIHEVQPEIPPVVPPTEPPTEPTIPPESDADSSTSSEESSVPSSASSEDTAVGEKNGPAFIYKGKAMAIFGAGPGMAEWYAQTINAYAAALPDVQVYNAVIPTSIEFGLPDKYKDVSAPQKPNIETIYANLDPSIKAVDAYSELEKNKDDYIYFGTDHHWTVRGAHSAYVAFAEQAGFEPIAYDDFTWKHKGEFLGTLYSQTQDASLRDHPDYVDYPVIETPHTAYMYRKGMPFSPLQTTVMAEYATAANKYSVFLHGDQPMMEIQTENKNGRRILIVKESYGNAFAPFLINHYETVYIVDQRYFELGLINFIKQHDVNELLFINNIFAANTPYHIQCIQGLMYQQYVPPEPSSSEEESSSEQSSDDSDDRDDDDDWQ